MGAIVDGAQAERNALDMFMLAALVIWSPAPFGNVRPADGAAVHSDPTACLNLHEATLVVTRS